MRNIEEIERQRKEKQEKELLTETQTVPSPQQESKVDQIIFTEGIKKKCPYCFTENNELASICSACRKKIGKVGKNGVAAKYRHPSSIIFIIATGVLVLGMLSSVFNSGNTTRSNSHSHVNDATPMVKNVEPEQARQADEMRKKIGKMGWLFYTTTADGFWFYNSDVRHLSEEITLVQIMRLTRNKIDTGITVFALKCKADQVSIVMNENEPKELIDWKTNFMPIKVGTPVSELRNLICK